MTSSAHFLFEALFNKSKQESSILQAIASIFLGISMSCYVWFSWLRATQIVKRHTPKAIISIFKYLLHTSPILCCIPGVTKLLSTISEPTLTYIFTCATAIVTAIYAFLDFFFAYTYGKQIRQMSRDLEVSWQLRTISKYGLVSSCLSLVSSALCLADLVFATIEKTQKSSTGLRVGRLIIICCRNFAFLSVGVALLLMKVGLFAGTGKDNGSGLETQVISGNSAVTTVKGNDEECKATENA
ncbi:hypothetical protein BDR26DRAFT_466876 [Obelidium mucronatum]|nr:hypothetical protein BDR26DRAFT_466876 [Obelidium mucronatum]